MADADAPKTGDAPLFPSAQQAVSSTPPDSPKGQEWELLKSGKNQTEAAAADARPRSSSVASSGGAPWAKALQTAMGGGSVSLSATADSQVKVSTKFKEFVIVLQQYLQKAKPFFTHFDVFVQRASELQDYYKEKYHSDEVLKCAFAAALLVAGGRFPLTIACAQSFSMWGWHTMKVAWKDLQESYTSTTEVLDTDAGLVADVRRTLKALIAAESPNDREVAIKKLLVIVKCVNPNISSDGLKGFWTGMVSVIAALRSRLVYNVCIGSTIGQNMREGIQQWMQGRLELSVDSRHWADVGLQKACGFVAISLSFMMSQKMNALNSALQGSTTLTKVLLKYIHSKKELTDATSSKTKAENEYQLVKWAVAMLGFAYQVTHHSDVPFVVKVPLAPLYLMERRLTSYATR